MTSLDVVIVELVPLPVPLAGNEQIPTTDAAATTNGSESFPWLTATVAACAFTAALFAAEQRRGSAVHGRLEGFDGQ